VKKRGQVFLIAALITIAVLAGLVTIYNRASSSVEDVTVFDLSEEIILEASQVIDSGIFNTISDTQISKNLE